MQKDFCLCVEIPIKAIRNNTKINYDDLLSESA